MNPVCPAQPTPLAGSFGGPQPAPAVPRGIVPQVAFRSLLTSELAVRTPPARDAKNIPMVRLAPLPELGPGVRVHASAARDDARLPQRSPREASDAFEPWEDHRRLLGSTDMTAWLSSPMSVSSPTLPGSTETLARSAMSLEGVWPAFVRRVAWSGDGKRGTARVEIGAGELAGATLLVHADAGRVRVRLETPPGADARSWRDRIERRLASRHIPTDEVEVS